jgi:hypothetical protein
MYHFPELFVYIDKFQDVFRPRQAKYEIPGYSKSIITFAFAKQQDGPLSDMKSAY